MIKDFEQMVDEVNTIVKFHEVLVDAFKKGIVLYEHEIKNAISEISYIRKDIINKYEINEDEGIVYNIVCLEELLEQCLDDDIELNIIAMNMELKLGELKKSLEEYLAGIHRLSLVVIVKNEGLYIEEWLHYHMVVGVEHFYIYDNESTDGLELLLKKYIDRGIVTYIPWPGEVVQIAAYNHAIENFKFDSEYIGFIDADEFIVPVDDVLLPDLLDELEKYYEESLYKFNGFHFGGLGVNWRMYGTSNNKNRQEGLIIQNYKDRAEDEYIEHRHIKTICNPRSVVGPDWNPHAFLYKAGYGCVSEHGSYIPSAFFYDNMCKKIRINHYHTKSEEEFEKKLKRGWPDQETVLSQEQIEERINGVEKLNAVYDFVMERYIERVKEKEKYFSAL